MNYQLEAMISESATRYLRQRVEQIGGLSVVAMVEINNGTAIASIVDAGFGETGYDTCAGRPLESGESPIRLARQVADECLAQYEQAIVTAWKAAKA